MDLRQSELDLRQSELASDNLGYRRPALSQPAGIAQKNIKGQLPSQLQLLFFLPSDNHFVLLLQNRCHQAVLSSSCTSLLRSTAIHQSPQPTTANRHSSSHTYSQVFFINQQTKEKDRESLSSRGSSDSTNPHTQNITSINQPQAKMPQKTQSARQYARPGCCYELPIEINDDEQTTTTRTRTKPVSVHTATWLEAKARGRWEAPTTTSGEPTPTNTVKCFEEKAGNRLRSSVNRPAVEAEPPQRCRVSSTFTQYNITTGNLTVLRNGRLQTLVTTVTKTTVAQSV